MLRRFAVATIGLFTAFSAAQASPIQWSVANGGNDHWYDFVAFAPGAVTWQQASTLAASSSFENMQGYLATVTSGAENSFLSSLSTQVGYLGGMSNGNGTWSWVDGPEAGQVFYSNGAAAPGAYVSWGWQKPDGYKYGTENYLNTNYGGAGQWNDIWNGGTSGYADTTGYFVEYSSPVPEASTWLMFGLAFGVVGTALRTSRARTLVKAG